jgi:hypothetical protein
MADDCWIIEGNEYHRCNAPAKEFRSVASIHNHSVHSVENLASLNRVITLPFMRLFSGILQNAFGLAGIPDLDYADVHYNPPLTPAGVLDLELESGRRLGFNDISFALTDHNNVLGCLELLEAPAAQQDQIGLGEELNVRFQNHLFHLGIVGLPADRLLAVHNELMEAAQGGRLDRLFEVLGSTGCLVVLNHPLLPWDDAGFPSAQVLAFMEQFGRAIDALEYNGMRCREENDAVLSLAQKMNKPVVGGGDSHFLTSSSALCVSRCARSMAEYIREIKEGKAITLIRKEYHAPMPWKIFLRVVGFIAQYRQIASYKQHTIESVIGKDRVLLDPVGKLARAFLHLVAALKLMR